MKKKEAFLLDKELREYEFSSRSNLFPSLQDIVYFALPLLAGALSIIATDHFGSFLFQSLSPYATSIARMIFFFLAFVNPILLLAVFLFFFIKRKKNEDMDWPEKSEWEISPRKMKEFPEIPDIPDHLPDLEELTK